MPTQDPEIVESSQKLMDPAGKEFQAMLEQSKVAAVEKLAVTDDTTMTEDPLVKPKEDTKAEDKPDVEAVDEPGDDIGNLKNKVSGLQAELTRVRKQKSGSAEEAQGLKERIADMEGQLKVLREGKTSSTLEDKVSKLTDAQVISNRSAWEDERTDARVEARLAAKENDQDTLAKANQRILEANNMLALYDAEKDRRAVDKVRGTRTADEEKTAIAKDLDNLFGSVAESAPDIFTKDTPIWKAGQEEYSKLPALMKQLGPLGELVAAASAIAKHPELVGKRLAAKVDKMVDNIEKAADKAFQKGGTAPSMGMTPFTTVITDRASLNSFEEQVRKVKSG